MDMGDDYAFYYWFEEGGDGGEEGGGGGDLPWAVDDEGFPITPGVMIQDLKKTHNLFLYVFSFLEQKINGKH